MSHAPLLVLLTFLIYYAFTTLRAWRSNIIAAKASGLPYIIIPIKPYSLKWVCISPLVMPILRCLPERWTSPWLGRIEYLQAWKDKYAFFESIGSDSYVTASPSGVMLWTCSPEACNEVLQRRNDFPKAREMIAKTEIYGRHVLSADGPEWREQRKIVAPAFGEKSNQLVWEESLQQSKAMLQSWFQQSDKSSVKASNLTDDAMRLSLHVISKAGFGKKIEWEHSRVPELKTKTSVFENGHTMSYEKAMSQWTPTVTQCLEAVTDGAIEHLSHAKLLLKTMLHRALYLVGLPPALLQYSPSAMLREAYQSYVEFGRYVHEMVKTRRDSTSPTPTQARADLLESLIRTSAESDVNEEDKSDSTQRILANAFVFLFAGHETTAVSLLLSFLYLAIDPSSQRLMQAEIDDIFKGHKPEEWSYETDMPKLVDSIVGAIMVEELRLCAPAPVIIRKTEGPQVLHIDGKQVPVPEGTFVNLSVLAAQRNPKYWPRGKPRARLDESDNDMNEFRPERWLAASPPADEKHARERLFKPVKGSFIAFSEGPRACIGKRFTQVEFAAVMAMIFHGYSVELVVNETDEEVASMTDDQKQQTWEGARSQAQDMIEENMTIVMTMQLKPGVDIPIRFVKRGKEMFR